MHLPPSPTTWNLDPIVLLALALLLAAYFAAIGPLGRRKAPDTPTSRGHITYFVSGWLILLLTLISPLDTLGRFYLFSAHTLQLFIIITAVAPFLMMGLPEWLVTLLVPTRVLRNATRGLLFPVIAAVAFNAIILIWHIGPLYERALHDEPLHDLENLCFLIAGILTWWPVLTPMDRHTRMSHPLQMLYLVMESLPLDIFGVAAIFAGAVFYPTYAAAPRLFLSPIEDQAAAGSILAVPGNIIDIVLMSVVFFIWIQGVERAQREQERLQYDAIEREQEQEQEAAGTMAENAGTPNAHVAPATGEAE